MGSLRKFLLKFLILAFILGGLFYSYKNDLLSRHAKEFLENSKLNLVIEGVRKEINTPGALIAKIESARAYLTKSGVLSFTNQERIRLDLRPLGSNATLDIVAKIRLEDMFAKQYFEHVSPTGDSASKEAERADYDYLAIGENIALGNFEDDEVLVAAWMASPGHRANILSTKFGEIGIAVGKGVYDGKSTWMAVQVFGKPLSSCPQVETALKSRIDNKESEIKNLEVQIKEVEAELREMERNRSSRQEYNRKVDEYNDLAREINSKISSLKLDISMYNSQVKAFNSCIGE